MEENRVERSVPGYNDVEISGISLFDEEVDKGTDGKDIDDIKIELENLADDINTEVIIYDLEGKFIRHCFEFFGTTPNASLLFAIGSDEVLSDLQNTKRFICLRSIDTEARLGLLDDTAIIIMRGARSSGYFIHKDRVYALELSCIEPLVTRLKHLFIIRGKNELYNGRIRDAKKPSYESFIKRGKLMGLKDLEATYPTHGAVIDSKDKSKEANANDKYVEDFNLSSYVVEGSESKLAIAIFDDEVILCEMPEGFIDGECVKGKLSSVLEVKDISRLYINSCPEFSGEYEVKEYYTKECELFTALNKAPEIELKMANARDLVIKATKKAGEIYKNIDIKLSLQASIKRGMKISLH